MSYDMHVCCDVLGAGLRTNDAGQGELLFVRFLNEVWMITCKRGNARLLQPDACVQPCDQAPGPDRQMLHHAWLL
jgi:hypothetical protein